MEDLALYFNLQRLHLLECYEKKNSSRNKDNYALLQILFELDQIHKSF